MTEAHGSWRPMETAPKDGTKILGINTYDEVFHCYYARTEEDEYCWWDDEADDDRIPLFWMPALPPRPQQ